MAFVLESFMNLQNSEYSSNHDNLNSRRIVISQHTTFTWGPGNMLSSYLRGCKELLFIHHPFDIKVNEPSFFEVFNGGELKVRQTVGSTYRPVLSFLKDFLLIFRIVLQQKQKYDLFIGIDPLNAFAGLILKYIGKVQTVIFYPIDYSPTRFNNKFLNWVYHYIERFSAKHSDRVWFLTRQVLELFLKKGADEKKCLLTLVQVEKIYYNKVIDRFKNPTIVYLGGLYPEKGVDLILDSMQGIIQHIPKVKLLIIGTGPEEEKLREKIKKNNIENCVEMKGYIESHNEALEMLSKCTIGIAPYIVDKAQYTGYGFGAKILEYLACGLPVVITRWKEIEDRGLGIVIDQSAEELTNAVIKLLNDESLYTKCRDSAYEAAKEQLYENVFDKAFASLNLKRN